MTKPKGVFKKRKQRGPFIKRVIIESIPSTSSASEISIIPEESNALLSSGSASKTKVGDLDNNYEEYFNKNNGEYDIINVSDFVRFIFSITVCQVCLGNLKFCISKRVGLSTTYNISCDRCGFSKEYSNSQLINNEVEPNQLEKKNGSVLYDINARFVYALRCIGKGPSAGNVLCGIMNLPSPPSKFKNYTDVVCKAVESIAYDSMNVASKEAVELNDMSRDLTVGIDGSWQKRGHTSLVGVVTVTNVESGKVLDASIHSKYCKCPHKLQNRHQDDCQANYKGVSGGMEVEGARALFKNSERLHGVRYKYYLGDGDSIAYTTVVKDIPYGSDFQIEKIECVGHVQKRMGTRLRNFKSKFGKQILSDGKPIGGRGRLTDERILAIQKYYGLAIRRNCGNLENMKKAVWALYFHLQSSDKFPKHGLCPLDENSWCKYQKAMNANMKYSHEDHFHVPEAVMKEIKPIFQDLSKPELLKKCLHGCTQNVNESLNSVIWSRLPKTTFIPTLPTLKFGVLEAIACFNDGNITRCRVLAKLGIRVGKNCAKVMKMLDKVRVQKAERLQSELMKKARQRRHADRKKLEEELQAEEDPDNPSYGAGMQL